METFNDIVSGVKAHLDIMHEDGVDFVKLSKNQNVSGSKAGVNLDVPNEQLSENMNLLTSEQRRKKLIDVFNQVSGCEKCEELVLNRNKIVFGAGNANADLLLIGEAPGSEEDKQGMPFVGKAGVLLTKMLAAIELKREDVFIANVLKCRPPSNRNPLPAEIMNCQGYLSEQIKLIQPKIICAMGSFAAHTLLNTQEYISRLRGVFHDYHGIKLLPTYHPAYLLRNPKEKIKVWEDLKLIKAELNK